MSMARVIGPLAEAADVESGCAEFDALAVIAQNCNRVYTFGARRSGNLFGNLEQSGVVLFGCS